MATAPKNNTPTVVVEFEKAKATKNTICYNEVVPEDSAAAVRTLYLQNATVKTLGDPAKILVTIAPSA
jgi:hypothetical protein